MYRWTGVVLGQARAARAPPRAGVQAPGEKQSDGGSRGAEKTLVGLPAPDPVHSSGRNEELTRERTPMVMDKQMADPSTDPPPPPAFPIDIVRTKLLSLLVRIASSRRCRMLEETQRQISR